MFLALRVGYPASFRREGVPAVHADLEVAARVEQHDVAGIVRARRDSLALDSILGPPSRAGDVAVKIAIGPAPGITCEIDVAVVRVDRQVP